MTVRWKNGARKQNKLVNPKLNDTNMWNMKPQPVAVCLSSTCGQQRVDSSTSPNKICQQGPLKQTRLINLHKETKSVLVLCRPHSDKAEENFCIGLRRSLKSCRFFLIFFLVFECILFYFLDTDVHKNKKKQTNSWGLKNTSKMICSNDVLVKVIICTLLF